MEITAGASNLTGLHDGVVGDLSNISGDVSGLSGDLSSLLGDVSGLSGLVSVRDVGEMGASNNFLDSAQVTALVGGSGLTGLNNDLNDFVSNHSPGAFSGVLGDVSDLSGNLSGLTGDLTNLSGDVSSLLGDVSGLSGDVSDIGGNVTNLSGDVSDISGYVSYISGDVSGLNGDVTGFKGDVTGMNGNPVELTALTLSAELDSAFADQDNTPESFQDPSATETAAANAIDAAIIQGGAPSGPITPETLGEVVVADTSAIDEPEPPAPSEDLTGL